MNNNYFIDIKNIRDLRFYLWRHKDDVVIANYLFSKSPKNHSYNDIFGMKPKLASLAINEAYKLIESYSELHLLHAKELKKMQQTQLPLKNFDWFKKCSNTCYFAWAYIRVLSNKNAHLAHGNYQENWYVYTKTMYSHLECEPFPENHKVRIESIIDFFDRCEWDLRTKLELMNTIKTEWYNRSRLLKSLPLKSNNRKMIQWAWEYIRKDKEKVQEGAKKREISAQNKIINDLGIKLINRFSTFEKLNSDLQNKYSYEKESELVIVNNELFELRANIAIQLKKKSSMETIKKTHLHSSSFLSLFMPSSLNETYLALVCAYNFLYYKDPHFIPRLSKSWESFSYRKSKKKNKKKLLDIINSELNCDELTSEVSCSSEGETIKNENSNLLEKQESAPPEQHSDANPWFG